MSGIEFNKIAGAVLTAALLFMVVGMLGDALVSPDRRDAADVQVAVQQPAAPPEARELPPIAPLLASADLAAGQREANRCTACHDMTQARQNRVGPPLWDIVMADKGGVAGYSYSPAMRNAEDVWTYEALNRFMDNPRTAIPGTKMVFAGMRDHQARANLIAYLRTLSDEPKPLP